MEAVDSEAVREALGMFPLLLEFGFDIHNDELLRAVTFAVNYAALFSQLSPEQLEQNAEACIQVVRENTEEAFRELLEARRLFLAARN